MRKEEDMEEFLKCTEDMMDFIDNSPTSFHAVANLKAALEKEGFQELKETMQWEVRLGEGYFVTRNDSSLIAFRLPKQEPAEKEMVCDRGCDSKNDMNVAAPEAVSPQKTAGFEDDTAVTEDQCATEMKTVISGISGFHITAAHSDSPAFKVKESPEMAVDKVYVKLNTEKYGGMNLRTWFDRALSVAGRVAVKGKNGIETRLVNIEKDLLVIPSVAVHLTRGSDKEELNPQVDLLPLYAEGDCEQKLFMKRVAEEAGVEPEEILGQDLFLYTREKGRLFGEKGEFILSPRLDDLQCAYTSARAFWESAPKTYINVCAIFDNEEVGSGTKQGADSTFLEDVLFRICESMGYGRSQYLRMIAGSFLISADNAHAVHPNHPEKSDPTNRPYLNRGLVIKFHGSQKYATDAVSAARMRQICEDAGAPCQTYANRSDIAGGSTLGNISTSHVSLSSVDVGLPQLAMHSAVETAGVKDTKYAIDCFREFFCR